MKNPQESAFERRMYHLAKAKMRMEGIKAGSLIQRGFRTAIISQQAPNTAVKTMYAPNGTFAFIAGYDRAGNASIGVGNT